MMAQQTTQWIMRLFLLHLFWPAIRTHFCFGLNGGLVRFANAFSSPRLFEIRRRSARRTISFPMGNSKLKVHSVKNLFVMGSHRQVDGASDVQIETNNIDAFKTDNKLSPTDEKQLIIAFDKVVNSRYACTRFQRYQEPSINMTNTTTLSSPASLPNPQVIRLAYQSLALSQRAPTGFNVQPYRIILVHEYKQKMELARYCLGRNADRIRDSDCTAVFLADEECGRDWRRFKDFLVGNIAEENETNKSRTRRPLSTKALNKMRVLILLFSSGYPLPWIISRPFSFFLRLGVTIVGNMSRWLYDLHQRLDNSSSSISKFISKLLPRHNLILPTLSSPTTWSQKNTILPAMTYMLACTARGLCTCPMEGFDAQGIRNVLGIPKRFSAPLIVSTGTAYRGTDEGVDDVGVSHGDGGAKMSPRYPVEDVVFGNVFGGSIVLPD